MATYVNDLRLKEIATGDESGTWGTSTNTNLELIAEKFGTGSEALSDASTATITMADGASDAFRSLALTLTGSLSQACTVTLAPNTLSNVWVVQNSAGDAVVGVSGNSVTASTTTPNIWGLVDDSQTANWSGVSTTQTPSWSAIDDSQTTNWSAVDDSQTPNWTTIDDSQTPDWKEVA